MWLRSLFLLLIALPCAAQMPLNGAPAPTLNGIGAPSVSCSSGLANIQYIDTTSGLPAGTRLYICDGTNWNHITGYIQMTGVTPSITPPTLVGCTTGTATVAGATTSMTAIASPVGSNGTGQINITAFVSAPNTVTVQLCLPLTLIYTAVAVPYKVLVY